jgi:hypothetical protein
MIRSTSTRLHLLCVCISRKIVSSGPEQLAHIPPCPGELRFGVSDGTVLKLGNLRVAITFQVMKNKYGSPACGKLRDGAADQYAINQADQRLVFRAILPPRGFFL